MNRYSEALDLAMATALGVVIEHPDQAGTVFSAVRIEDFAGQYRTVAEAIHSLRLSKTTINPLAVIDEMTRRGTIGRAGGAAEIARIAGFGFGSADYAVQVIARNARLTRIAVTAARLSQTVNEVDDVEPLDVARIAITELQGVVDGIEADGDVTTPTLREFLSVEDAPYDWVIPGLLERGDRFILTGSEGLGKSVLHRQLAVCAAAGVHPFTGQPIPPMRVLYVDCENGPTKSRRALRPLVEQAMKYGSDPRDRMHIEAIPAGLDLTTPEDEMWLVRRVSSLQPDLLAIGPLCRLHSKNPNDEEVARTVTRVLDRCRAAANCALISEAHAGHANGQATDRPVRPVGSSLWLRWPEFGYGLRTHKDFTPENRVVDMVPWRGDREERNWPKGLRSGGTWPWTEDVRESPYIGGAA